MPGYKDTQARQAERGDETNPTLACVIPQSDNYISSKQFAKKYGLELRKMQHACRAKALIADLRGVPNPERGGRIDNRWFILDIPPNDHPKWKAYIERMKKKYADSKRTGISGYKSLKEAAPELLRRFNEARLQLAQSDFSTQELARMLKLHTPTIYRWVEAGEEGFGRLPKIQFPEDKMEKYGRVDSFFRQEDVIRFLKGELADPTQRFKTISDMVADTTIDEIAARHGYFIFEKARTYEKSYEGFMAWAEDNVLRFDKATDKWIPFRAIEMQRKFYRKVFELNKDGTFKNRFIRICRPRGDMKSFDAIIIFLFRFFNLRRQKILLAANSKDQSDYSLYDEAKDIILNSPNLYSTPGLEVREKETRIMSGRREIYSRIQSIASKQGSLSNADCIVFSEIHKLQDQSFIVELEGSIRQVKDAMSIIESTVSRIGTYYHRQFEAYNKGESKVMYFQHYADTHYNPNMTQEELDHYKVSFFPEEYDMYFRNRWGDAGQGLFSTAQIENMNIVGIDGAYGRSAEISEAVAEIIELRQKLGQLGGTAYAGPLQKRIREISARFLRTDTLYKLPADERALDKLRQAFQTDFIIGMGLDRAEQMVAKSDRTALVTVARGILTFDLSIFFLLDVYLPDDPSMRNITTRIMDNAQKFGWIDHIDVEKSQGMDIEAWCNENGISANLVTASYEHQKEMFTELYTAMAGGMLKCPEVPAWVNDKGVLSHELPPPGVDDILRMELTHFIHAAKVEGVKAGYFGSPFKRKTGRTKAGEAKDDTVFATAHAMYASKRGDIPASVVNTVFSGAQINTDVVGDYSVRG